MKLLRGVSLAAAALALLAPPASGQSGGQSQRQQTMRSRRSPPQIHIQGSVVFADGTPAPADVVIERLCDGGRPIDQTHTDSKGRFSFRIGELSGFTPDATHGFASAVPGQAGPELNRMSGLLDRDHPDRIAATTLAGCSLTASLPGFHSTSVMIGRRDTFDDPDVGVIVLEPMRAAGAMPVSIASLRAPEGAREAYEKGLEALREGKWDRARGQFEKAVKEFPGHAQAWYALGQVLEQERDVAGAREAFERAAAEDESYLTPWLGLVRLDAGAGRWEAVARESERILSLNGDDFPEAYFYNAVANFSLGRNGSAELSAREAIARGAQQQFPQVLHLLGLALANQNAYEEAAQHLKSYLELAPDSEAAPTARRQLAAIESALAERRSDARQP